MTYVHADACVVVGPLSRRAEPRAHDLCAAHAGKLTPPVGWQLIRIEGEQAPAQRSHDDLLAIADAVREAAGPPRNSDNAAASTSSDRNDGSMPGRKHGHLRIIGDS